MSNFLSDVYAYNNPVLSLEFFPPKNEQRLDEMYAQIRSLAEHKPHFMTVTYGAGGGTRAMTREIVSYISRELGLPAVAHLTCVGHGKSEIDEVLAGLFEEQISNILALRGDPPKGSDRFIQHPDGFANAMELVAHIAKKGRFSIAVAGYPETHRDARSRREDIEYLKRKVDAGASVVITQLFFEPDFYLRFVDDATAAGVNVPIVPGIMPIANVVQVKKFTSMCGASIPLKLARKLDALQNDPEGVVEFGIDYAVNTSEVLLSSGAPGLHLYTLNKSRQISPIIEQLQLSRK